MHLHSRWFRLCVVLLVLLSITSTAHAITPNTIRGYYGLELGQDVTPLKEELAAVSATLRTAETINSYNAIIENYSSDEIDAQITDLSNRLSDIQDILYSSIDLPLGEIVKLETEYYQSVPVLDSLLQTRDFMLARPLIPQEEDVDALHLAEQELIAAIQEAGYYENVGELGQWPVPSVKRQYNSNFGTRWDPITKASYSYHAGVDLYAPMGTPVVTVFHGVVSATGYSTSGGNYVYVDHGNGVRTFYCHLSKIECSVGDVVKQGDEIALSGNTGSRTTGPHLHFAIYIDGTAVDPKVVLERD